MRVAVQEADGNGVRLLPRNFAHASLDRCVCKLDQSLSTHANALVVPNQAVQTGQQGEFVFVVKNDRTVESRPVSTGIRIDQELVVDKGLEFGETVVIDGQLRLAPGARVSVRDNRAKPGAGGPPATSVHCYSPPLWRMGYYEPDRQGALCRTSMTYLEEVSEGHSH